MYGNIKILNPYKSNQTKNLLVVIYSTSLNNTFLLFSLSGRGHTVYTGVVVKAAEKVIKFTEKTNVIFGKLDDEQIRGYIATGEPM